MHFRSKLTKRPGFKDKYVLNFLFSSGFTKTTENKGEEAIARGEAREKKLQWRRCAAACVSFKRTSGLAAEEPARAYEVLLFAPATGATATAAFLRPVHTSVSRIKTAMPAATIKPAKGSYIHHTMSLRVDALHIAF